VKRPRSKAAKSKALSATYAVVWWTEFADEITHTLRTSAARSFAVRHDISVDLKRGKGEGVKRQRISKRKLISISETHSGHQQAGHATPCLQKGFSLPTFSLLGCCDELRMR